jgi:hypothetical protein
MYSNKKVCLTDKDHFIDPCKHSGMVNTKFKKLYYIVTNRTTAYFAKFYL